MAERELKIRMLLEAADRFSKPFRNLLSGSRKANAELKATRDRLKEIDRAQADIGEFRRLKTGLREAGGALAAAQTKVGRLAREIAAADAPSRKLTAEFSKAKREATTLATQLDRDEVALQRLRDRMAAAGVSTTHLVEAERRLRTESAKTTAEIERQSRRIQASDDRSRRFAAGRERFGKIQGAATGLVAGGTGAIASGVATGMAVAAPVKDAMAFEDVMADVNKVVTFTAGDSLPKLSAQIIDLSKHLPMAAEGIGQIVAAGGRSGIKDTELLGFAQDAVKMAVAFDMSADEAGTMMATWRTAFHTGGEGVRELGDRVNALTNRYGGNVVAVNEIVTRIGPLGEVAGTASGQIAAMAQMMSKMGLESDVGATGIKNLLLALSRGKATTPHAAAAFKDLGLDATDMAKRMQKDAGGAILDIFHRIAKLDKASQAGVLTRLFGRESIAAIAPMLTNLDQLQANFDLVGNKAAYAGSMEKEYQTRATTTSNAVALGNNHFKALKTTLGDLLLPTVRRAAHWVGVLSDKFDGFAKSHPLIAKGLLIGVAAMALMMILGGGLAIAVGGLVAPFAALAMASTALGIGMLPLAGIVLGVVVGIGLLAAAAYLIYSNWGPIGAFFARLWAGIKATVSGVMAWFADLPARFAAFGRNMITGLISGITGMLGQLKSTIVGAASSAAEWFKSKLGIHSPSRVFASFGGHLMTGLSQGIDGGRHEPVRRIDRLSRDIAAALAIGAAAPAVAAGGGGSAAASAARAAAIAGPGNTYQIHLHAAPGMDEQRLVQLLERKLAEIKAREAAAARSRMRDHLDGE